MLLLYSVYSLDWNQTVWKIYRSKVHARLIECPNKFIIYVSLWDSQLVHQKRTKLLYIHFSSKFYAFSYL